MSYVGQKLRSNDGDFLIFTAPLSHHLTHLGDSGTSVMSRFIFSSTGTSDVAQTLVMLSIAVRSS